MATCRQMRKRRVTFFLWVAGVMPRRVKRSEKTKTDPKVWESYVLHLGYLRIIVFFFPVGGGQFFGGEKSCHFWCCNEAHPTREVEDTACCSSSLVNRPMGIPQLKGDSTLSGRTASHNHQTSTGNDQSPKRYRVSSLKSPFTSKHACYNTLP